jgi:hypothetical protein
MVFALALSACAPRVAREVAPAPVFVDATPLLGEDVVVHGVLRWQDRSRELVPADDAGARRLPRPCLPILIPLGEQALADAATRLNGKRVRVEGVIVDAVPRGLVATKACQAVGLRVAVLDAE